MNLPYRYEVKIPVVIVGDGLHADGDGAIATIKRLAKLLETDDHVERASSWTDIAYAGKNEGEK